MSQTELIRLKNQIQILTDELSNVVTDQDDTVNFINSLKLGQIEYNADVIRKKTILSRDDYSTIALQELQTQLHQLQSNLTRKGFEITESLDSHRSSHKKESELSDSPNIAPTVGVEKESLESLKRRLLGNRSSQLDNYKSSADNLDDQNDYHSNLQEEIIGDMGYLASSLRESVLKIQESFASDAILLSDTSDQLEKNKSLFSVVGTNLVKYHRSGQLGIFFYLKWLAGVFFIMFVLVFIVFRIF